jgi:hypothetical protein
MSGGAVCRVARVMGKTQARVKRRPEARNRQMAET